MPNLAERTPPRSGSKATQLKKKEITPSASKALYIKSRDIVPTSESRKSMLPLQSSRVSILSPNGASRESLLFKSPQLPSNNRAIAKPLTEVKKTKNAKDKLTLSSSSTMIDDSENLSPMIQNSRPLKELSPKPSTDKRKSMVMRGGSIKTAIAETTTQPDSVDDAKAYSPLFMVPRKHRLNPSGNITNYVVPAPAIPSVLIEQIAKQTPKQPTCSRASLDMDVDISLDDFEIENSEEQVLDKLRTYINILKNPIEASYDDEAVVAAENLVIHEQEIIDEVKIEDGVSDDQSTKALPAIAAPSEPCSEPLLDAIIEEESPESSERSFYFTPKEAVGSDLTPMTDSNESSALNLIDAGTRKALLLNATNAIEDIIAAGDGGEPTEKTNDRGNNATVLMNTQRTSLDLKTYYQVDFSPANTPITSPAPLAAEASDASSKGGDKGVITLATSMPLSPCCAFTADNLATVPSSESTPVAAHGIAINQEWQSAATPEESPERLLCAMLENALSHARVTISISEYIACDDNVVRFVVPVKLFNRKGEVATSMTLLRRYSEFYSLNSSLENSGIIERLRDSGKLIEEVPAFPTSELGPSLWSFWSAGDHALLQSRQLQLQDWLHGVVQLQSELLNILKELEVGPAFTLPVSDFDSPMPPMASNSFYYATESDQRPQVIQEFTLSDFSPVPPQVEESKAADSVQALDKVRLLAFFEEFKSFLML